MAATTILLMGVQGAGKGTQAEILQEKLHIPHITTGGMFRDMKSLDTPLAREIQAIMAAGNLVPDDITNQVVRERFSKPDIQDGAILDGYPRTLPQAEAFDKMLLELGIKLTAVLSLELDKDIAIDRIAERRECIKDSQHIYNLKYQPPKVPGVCDIDGAPLKERADDNREAVTLRINDYYAKTAPLLDYYRQRGLLHEVDAFQTVGQVTADLMTAIDAAIKLAGA